jgi:cell wall-associated NlpC family hydrolase
MAAAAYEGQSLGSAGAMLNTGDSQAVMNQAALIGQLSITQATEVRQFTAAALRLREARTIALRAESGVALLDRQLLARKRSVMRSLHRQRALLSSLTARQREAAAQSMPGLNASLSGTYSGPTGTQADQAVAYAYSKLGDPYVWGATGPSTFDCSGLAMAAWASAGVTIPRTTFEQVAALPAVPLSALRPGDLLFFLGDDHVGMYVGGGYLIDAPHTGAYVEKVPFTGWYRSTFVSAARP